MNKLHLFAISASATALFAAPALAQSVSTVDQPGSGSTATVELWQPAAHDIAAGDGFTVTAGCDKRFATCRTRFLNGVNFRGFPHMPGNDFVLFVARAGDGNTGAPVVP